MILYVFFLTAESAKNSHAEKLLDNVLDNATWINIHGLPVGHWGWTLTWGGRSYG